jgi:hypothetical protein
MVKSAREPQLREDSATTTRAAEWMVDGVHGQSGLIVNMGDRQEYVDANAPNQRIMGTYVWIMQNGPEIK